jgi:hypothetical protein
MIFIFVNICGGHKSMVKNLRINIFYFFQYYIFFIKKIEILLNLKYNYIKH